MRIAEITNGITVISRAASGHARRIIPMRMKRNKTMKYVQMTIDMMENPVNTMVLSDSGGGTAKSNP